VAEHVPIKMQMWQGPDQVGWPLHALYGTGAGAGGTKQTIKRETPASSPSAGPVVNAHPVLTRGGKRQKEGVQIQVSPSLTSSFGSTYIPCI
jgi:hypothetical protein